MFRFKDIILLGAVILSVRELQGQQRSPVAQTVQEIISNFHHGSNVLSNNQAQGDFTTPQRSQKNSPDTELTPESFQGRVLKAQEEFRKSVAEANRVGSNPTQGQGTSFRSRQNFIDHSTSLNSGSMPEQKSQAVFSDSPQHNVFIHQDPQTPTFQRIRTDNSQKLLRPGSIHHTHTISNTVNQFQPPSESSSFGTRQNDDGEDFSQIQQTGRQNAVRQRQRVQSIQDTVDDEETVRQQAENAQYSFTSMVNDGINDHNHVRAETRDGLKVDGIYSYSDGFFKHTVHYAADENGYRIVKQEVEPIGDGPQLNPAGKADVSRNLDGSNFQYTITRDDIAIREPQFNRPRRSN